MLAAQREEAEARQSALTAELTAKESAQAQRLEEMMAQFRDTLAVSQEQRAAT